MWLHKQILAEKCTKDDFDFEKEDEVRSKVDEQYYCSQIVYNELIAKSATPISQDALSTISTNNNKSSRTRLQKIKIPTFDGNFGQWTSFRDLFKSLVHEDDCLSDVEKFHYLITSLVGEPLTLVKTLPLTEDNYKFAYQSLINRYNNERALATYYLEQMFNYPKLQSESHKQLRNLTDIFTENLAALTSLKLPTEHWDFVMFYLLLSKLDMITRKAYELSVKTNSIPKYENLKDFILNHCQCLEAVTQGASNAHHKTPIVKQHLKPKVFLANTLSNTLKCPRCAENHYLSKCLLFLNKTPRERYNLIKQHHLCVTCLKQHQNAACSSTGSCRSCNSKGHHSLLHFDVSATQVSTTVTAPKLNVSSSLPVAQPQCNEIINNTSLHCDATSVHQVLLATALIEVQDAFGEFQTIRCLLDSGSQCSFVTSKCMQRLKLRQSPLKMPIHGLGQTFSVNSTGTVSCIIRPHRIPSLSLTLDAIIIPKICGTMPTTEINITNWQHLSNLNLADPTFNRPGNIDILIGAELFPQIVLEGRISGPAHQATALNTIFGWVLMGKTTSQNKLQISSFCVALEPPVEQTLRQFWELEEPPQKLIRSPDDETCDMHYLSTVKREILGRYTVSLPFKESNPEFPDSRNIALRRFHLLEKRLERNPILKQQYDEFMLDYIQQGHMSLIHDTKAENTYYIPHHCVVRPDKLTTKLRVVFDASTKASNKKSLNETLHTGPKLIADLITVLLKFRIHTVALTADMRQMYRQIWVTPEHRSYQRIIWRFNSKEPISDYQLNTVTFGLGPSPYLAIRTVHQLALDEQVRFPQASSCLMDDVYVDDLVTGCESYEEAQVLKSQLTSLCQSGGFSLHKWMSNYSPLASPKDTSISSNNESFSFTNEADVTIKVLGLKWHPSDDYFSYSVHQVSNRPCTKRAILSEIARIFDPIGFLSPLSLFAKHLIQHLWFLHLDWDETPPAEVVDRWEQYKFQLALISQIKVKRHIPLKESIACEIHGFCDASEAGYAAVVYLRTINSYNNININLVLAKSKVAPLKRVSIPRLELCGAHLLAKLIGFVKSTYSGVVSFSSIHAWTDSTVALCWLRSSPHRWKTFISNRVCFIQEQIPPSSWKHVRSSDNPADCASRGILPEELVKHSLWWSGPEWLRQERKHWPSLSILPTSPEQQECIAIKERLIVLTVSSSPSTLLDLLLERISSLSKLQSVLAYIYRFIHNLKNPHNRIPGPLSQAEINSAITQLVKHVQHKEFGDEIIHLKAGRGCSTKTLRKLHPFVDEEGILRVGGRLRHSTLSFGKKHPMLLPQKHHLTYLIIDDCHKSNLHPGPQTLHFLLNQRFWILSARRAIRHRLALCHRCFRAQPKALVPLMGDLPTARVSQVKPFSHSGVDFAGPFKITMGKYRGTKTSKAYICLFVCFATKALHLELVSELSSEAFLAAFRRFISRRGRCSDLYSDCGTNFVGANKLLLSYSREVAAKLTINWHFNPPAAPNFGGLWEAGVKSVTTHLIRVVGEQILTYEEFNTVLIQIEALLNSRPLCAISPDPNDFDTLTPGHFLTLEPLTSLPEQDLNNIKINRLTRWQLLKRCHQDFWRRWHLEYLHTLQQRSKWNQPSANINPDTLVLIKDNNAPPLQWILGRIIQTHPGSDGICRVATVKTASGIFKRPVSKLCPLPSE